MPRGGKRTGAGRKTGSVDTVNRLKPRGATSALKSLRHRVPEGTPDALADIAGEAFQAIVDVMRGESYGAEGFTILSASKLVREEVCGPVKQKHEVTGADGGPVQVSISISRAPHRTEYPPLPVDAEVAETNSNADIPEVEE